VDTEKEAFEAALREDLGDDPENAYGDTDDLGAWTSDGPEGEDAHPDPTTRASSSRPSISVFK
jgi:hypothetical protein